MKAPKNPQNQPNERKESDGLPSQGVKERSGNDAPSCDRGGSEDRIVEEILESEVSGFASSHQQPEKESKADVVEALEAHDLRHNEPWIPHHSSIKHDSERIGGSAVAEREWELEPAKDGRGPSFASAAMTGAILQKRGREGIGSRAWSVLSDGSIGRKEGRKEEIAGKIEGQSEAEIALRRLSSLVSPLSSSSSSSLFL